MTAVINFVIVYNFPADIEVRCNEYTPVYPEIKERLLIFSDQLISDECLSVYSNYIIVD